MIYRLLARVDAQRFALGRAVFVGLVEIVNLAHLVVHGTVFDRGALDAAIDNLNMMAMALAAPIEDED